MNQELTKVLLERERLLARSAQQRADVASAFAQMSGPISLLDRALEVGRFLRSHPAAVALVALSVVVLRGRTVLGTVARAVSLWRLVRRVRTWSHLLGF